MQQSLFGLEHPDIEDNKLHVVYAQYQGSEPYSSQLFDGFTSLRVLTYSVSVEMVVRMLNRFESVECVFGYEGVLDHFSTILAWQKTLSENLLTAIKSLEDERKQFIVEKIRQRQIVFYVVKDSIAHSKIYLLENGAHRRVIVGSANLSDRAFSGKQAETIVVFDDDVRAWEHYQREYEAVRQSATSEFTPRDLTQTEVAFQDIPLLKDVQNAKSGVTVFVNVDTATATLPTVVRTVERVADQYKGITQPLAKPHRGQVRITREIVGKIVQLTRSQKREDLTEEQTWLSIYPDTGKVILNGQEVSLEAQWEQVCSDVTCLVEYFENFKNGFYGDIDQHQRDYFMFMCWFYFSPFICDLRNYANIHQNYIFDFPQFAVLYGKSNCGKTRLIETLMKSMFGYFQFMDKANFTRTRLRTLLQIRKRFPVVFDDVDKTQFSNHAPDIIKDETFILQEYPAFVLSMNAEDHSFLTELRKRCLILYIKASLPDNTLSAKELYNSVMAIQNRITTSLYREYLKRVLEQLSSGALPQDVLKFSSGILTDIFDQAFSGPLPAWCSPLSMDSYTGKRYEKIRLELLKLYETQPTIWELRRHEAVLRLQHFEAFGLRKDIPDWILKEGSRGGNVILDRHALEEFLGTSLRKRRLPRLLR
ncbi:MAG: phospholipase D family protein [Chloroflexota bacterium]|jgi:hypothetical protein